MYPQKLPLVTEPVTVRWAASTLTCASVLTSSELAERILPEAEFSIGPVNTSPLGMLASAAETFPFRTSMVAGWPAGKADRPEPVRVVAVSSALAPESSLTE